MTSDPARMPNLDIAHLLDEIAELAPEQVPDAVASQAAPLIDAAAAVQQALLERVQRAPSLAFLVLGAWLQNANFIASALWERDPETDEEFLPRRLSRGGQAFLRSIALREDEVLRIVPTARLSAEEMVRLDRQLYHLVQELIAARVVDVEWFAIIGTIVVRALIWAGPGADESRRELGRTLGILAAALVEVGKRDGPSLLPLVDLATSLSAWADLALSDDPEDQANCRINWAIALETRYEAPDGSLEQHLERALELYAQAEPQLAGKPIDQANCWVNLASALVTRYHAPGGSLDQHLERALTLFEQAEAQLADQPGDQARCRSNWAGALEARYQAPGSSLEHHLERALQLYAQVDPELADQPLDQAGCRMNWATALQMRYQAPGGSLEQHLERALTLFEQAEPQLADQPGDQANCRINWATALGVRFKAPGGSLEQHLERAMALYEQAEPQLARQPVAQGGCRMGWANALQDRYQASGGLLEDLDLALALYEQAEPQLASKPWSQANCRTSWANALRLRYQAVGGALDNLDHALALYERADLQLHNNPEFQAICRSNWANALLIRYRSRGGSLGEHLERGLALYEQAEPRLVSRPESQANCRMNWATALQIRYAASRGSSEQHLDRALDLYEKAESQLHNNPQERTTCLLNWAAALQTRYGASGGSPRHLAQAQRLALQALQVAEYRSAIGEQLRARVSLARTALLQNDPAAAAEALRPAQDLLEGALLLMPDEFEQDHLIGEHAAAIDLLLHSLLTVRATAINQQHAAQASQYAEEIWQVQARRTARHTVQNLLTSVLDNTPPDAINQAFARLAVARRQQALLAQARSTLDGPTSPASVGPEDKDERLRHERSAADLEVALAEQALFELDSSLRRLVRVEAPEIAAVQRALATIPDGAAMLQLVPMPDQVVLLVLNGSELHLRSLPVTVHDLVAATSPLIPALWGPSDQELDAFQAFLHQADPVPDGVLADEREQLDVARTARAQAENRLLNLEPLGPLLWAELEPLLPAVSSDALASGRVPHLFLVPGGPFQFWPLWILPLHANSDAEPDSGVERLGDRYACSLLPAPDALPALLAQQPADGPLQALAPPTNLTFARAQACFEARVTGGTVYLDDQASFATLRGIRGGAVGLYTHASFDLQSPHRSGVVLARVSGRADDSSVCVEPTKPEPELAAIASRDGVADTLSTRLELVSALECALGLTPGSLTWIHLLACGTHIGGGLQQGERWTGLTAAFLRVAPQLLATLWRVDDLAAAVLSVPYQSSLASGATLAQALRQAVRALRMVDREQLTAWVAELRASLPDEPDRTRFDAAWAARQQHLPPAGPCFPLPLWAPFIAVGAPCSGAAGGVPPNRSR